MLRTGCIFMLCICMLGAAGQMSPFDGSYTIVAKLNVSSLPAGGQLVLLEVTPPTDSCRFSEKPIRTAFQEPQQVLIQNRNNNKVWESRAQEYAKSATFMAPGYFAVVLSMGERTCMTPEGDNYRYTERTFSIVAVQGGRETVLARVPARQVYDLGYMRGKWNEIEAVKVKWPKTE